jgi:Protein of unknown function (DUF2934)
VARCNDAAACVEAILGPASGDAGRSAGAVRESLHARIAHRAYLLHLERGAQENRALEDWLAAEDLSRSGR